MPGGGELMQQIEALEGELMELSIEKSSLETEYAKMPGGAGRTMKERQRKAEVEARLEELGREISKVRLSLKKLGVR